MSRNNTIGIVGRITAPVGLMLGADDWRLRVYETRLTRIRPSGTEDTYILRFTAQAAGTEEMLAKIKEGACVLIGGEIRTENIQNPRPDESRVRIYIYAEVIAVNDPPADDQNEVKLRGFVCRTPWCKQINRRQADGSRTQLTDMIIAVNTPTGTSYIPCVYFGDAAVHAAKLQVGDRIEVYGRFHARCYEKRIAGDITPHLSTAYEVCAVSIRCIRRKDHREEETKA